MPYRRPPRDYREAPRRQEVRIAAPPAHPPPAQGAGGAAIYLLPALAGLGSVALLFTGYGGQNRWLASVAVAAVSLSVLSGVLLWWFQRLGT